MKVYFGAAPLLLAASASEARIERVRRSLADSDRREMEGAFQGGAWEGPHLREAAELMRSGLRKFALSDGAAERGGDECRAICEEDVLADDVCIGTPSNPVPNGDVWMFSRDIDTFFFGCCAFGLGECKECCPPTDEDRRAFENADEAELVDFLYAEAGEDIQNFETESNDNNPWKLFEGVCLTLNNFTIVKDGNVPLSHVMNAVVIAGIIANGNEGRTRNGFFFTDGDVYHEMSQLSFLGAGSITYRVLGYDYGDQDSGDGPRPGIKRVVELPWQLAPHGRAIYAKLEQDPAEYEARDKIAYRLISPYIGEVLVKVECCTAEELVTYQDVSEGGLGFLTRPDPPVRYTSTAEECEAMAPAYVTFPLVP